MSEDTYLAEGQAQRAHELALAKVEADTQVELARVAAHAAEERRTWWGWVLVGVAVVTVVLAIIAAIVWGVHNGNIERERNSVRQAQVAEVCIRAGNIWLHGDCLLANKTPG
jgi:hypothetical protein